MGVLPVAFELVDLRSVFEATLAFGTPGRLSQASNGQRGLRARLSSGAGPGSGSCASLAGEARANRDWPAALEQLSSGRFAGSLCLGDPEEALCPAARLAGLAGDG